MVGGRLPFLPEILGQIDLPLQKRRFQKRDFQSSFAPVFEKTCVTTQKNVKGHVFFWILKKRKKRTYSFTLQAT